jgi:hypothetical protein
MMNPGTKLISVPTLLLGALISAGSGVAADNVEVAIRYGVDIKGVTVMKVNYLLQIEDGIYKSDIQAKTTGFANWLSDYKMAMGSSGALKESGVVPANFTRERKKKGKWKGATTNWRKGAPLIDEESGGEDYASMADAVDGVTLDPLTLLLRQSLGAGAGAPCEGRHRVYDGRDVYDVTFSGDSGVNRDTVSCHIRLSYVAGREVERSKPQPAKPDDYDLTLRRVNAERLGRAIWLPEEITGRASGQRFVARAIEMSVR